MAKNHKNPKTPERLLDFARLSVNNLILQLIKHNNAFHAVLQLPWRYISSILARISVNDFFAIIRKMHESFITREGKSA